MKRVFLSIAIMMLASPVAHSDIDETRTTLREHVLKLINRDRKLYNLPPVQLDLEASAIGDDYCRRQIQNRTNGHFTTDGLAPYMRYSFAGGNDGVSENAAAWSANYTFSERALYEMARRSTPGRCRRALRADRGSSSCARPSAASRPSSRPGNAGPSRRARGR